MTAPLTAEALVESLRKSLAMAANDPGNVIRADGTKVGYKGDRCMGGWIAEAIIAGPLAPLLAAEASLQRVTAERDEARALADGNLAAGNEELRDLGTFDRKMKVGKHQATNRVHLRAVIAALDEAGHSDAADTLIWQVWHRVNSVARAHEFMRLANAEEATATAEAARLRGEVEALTAVLKPFADVCDAEHMRHVRDEQVLELSTRSEVPVSEKLRGAHFRAARTALARAATEEGQADG